MCVLQVTHDWDRRLLESILQQQLLPGTDIANNTFGDSAAPGQVPGTASCPTIPTADTLLPERVMGGVLEFSTIR